LGLARPVPGAADCGGRQRESVVRRRKIDLAELMNEPWTRPQPGGPGTTPQILAAFKQRSNLAASNERFTAH